MEPMASPADITDIISPHATMQHMHELESIQWTGGPLHWDGPHENFCFVCGGSVNLFNCQTCDAAYHAECMSPTLGLDDVPKYWFCPHCVEHGLHIPSIPNSYFTPVSIPGTLKSPTDYFTPIPIPAESRTKSGESSTDSNILPKTPFMHPSEHNGAGHRSAGMREKHDNYHEKQSKWQCEEGTRQSAMSNHRVAEPSNAEPQTSLKRGRRRRSLSPVKKKSKYSVFSAEVEKALGVIHSELQTAAECGKAESHLRNRLCTMEQELKLQSGQLALARRELEIAKKDLAIERFKAGRYAADTQAPKEEIARLKELLSKKDAELEDWRSKLKSLLGNG